MRTGKHVKKTFSHTAINIILIAIILCLYAVISNTGAVCAWTPDIVYRIDSKDGIALECVVAWDSEYTSAILDILERENVQISFVVSGALAQENPQLVRRIAAQHELISCGMHYDDTENLTEGLLAESIELSQEVIAAVANQKVEAYYCPTSETGKAAGAAGIAGVACVRSGVDLLAARGTNEEIVERFSSAIHMGEIFSFTPTAAMKAALPRIIAMCKNNDVNIKGVCS